MDTMAEANAFPDAASRVARFAMNTVTSMTPVAAAGVEQMTLTVTITGKDLWY